MSTTPNYAKLKNTYYWIGFLIGYVLPFAYFAIKLGFTEASVSSRLVMPTIIVGTIGIIKLASDIPQWVSAWEPSLFKGLVKASPKILLFIVLITLGLTLKYVIENAIDVAFTAYFETVIVLFGSMAVASVFDAFHLKYKELYLLSKGYVLGVVNK
jgi:hypothetical protein